MKALEYPDTRELFNLWTQFGWPTSILLENTKFRCTIIYRMYSIANIISTLYLYNIFHRKKRNKVFEGSKISKRKICLSTGISFNFFKGSVQMCHNISVSNPAIQNGSILLHSAILNLVHLPRNLVKSYVFVMYYSRT